MRKEPQPSLWKRSRRARAALICGLAVFIGSQLALEAAMHTRWPVLHDWDFGEKLRRLQAAMQEQEPGQPLVLVLGSSRAALGVRPDMAPAQVTPGCHRPLVFNFAFPCFGPVRELVSLRRVLDRGIRPDLLIIECWPPFMSRAVAPSEADSMEVVRAQWGDLRTLQKYSGTPQDLPLRWLESHWLPCYSDRKALMWNCVGGVPPALDAGLCHMESSGGYDWDDRLLDAPAQGKRRAGYQETFIPLLATLTISEVADGALREMLTLCGNKAIPVALLYMPEDSQFRRWYPPHVNAAIDAYFAGLRRDFGVPLVVARDWIEDRYFSDFVHLLPEGARAFTDRLEREAIPRLFDERSGSGRYAARR
jgi:hypothetical protein